jgi:adenylate cyclase
MTTIGFHSQFFYMRYNLIRKLKTLALICLFTSLAGVLYQLINEMRLTFNSVIIGLPLGLAFGFLELFLFPKAEVRFRQWSFTKMLLFKTLLYTAIIYTITLVLTFIEGYFEGRKLSELPPHLVSLERMVLVIYTLVIYSMLIFLLQIKHLLGEGILWKFISGKYHKPREEERVFMFLDMKSSTAIAEQLGHVRFYTLLNELFHEISQPVLQTKAEIYQYVGDEVVLTWRVEDGIENANCLKAFFMFRENLLKNRISYLKRFGVEPEFKAGLHFGKVISAQIGDLKKEIVYNGDVLNTAARIRNECNVYQRDCLVSGTLMQQLKSVGNFQWEKLDTVALRGKGTEIELFSVNNIHPATFILPSQKLELQ